MYEVRRIAVLPEARTLEPDRPTVIFVDDALLARVAGTQAVAALADGAALVGVGASGTTTSPTRSRDGRASATCLRAYELDERAR